MPLLLYHSQKIEIKKKEKKRKKKAREKYCFKLIQLIKIALLFFSLSGVSIVLYIVSRFSQHEWRLINANGKNLFNSITNNTPYILTVALYERSVPPPPPPVPASAPTPPADHIYFHVQ